MKEFQDFLNIHGISDAKNLLTFLEKFGDNPDMFFKLTAQEKCQIEKQMDQALAAIIG